MTDVLVVGAGPTGLMLAAELALAGVQVKVLERRTEPQPNSRALTLHPRSIELMDQRGIADRFLAQGHTVPNWHFAGLSTRLDFAALDTRHPYTLLLPQARTERILGDWVRELGVDVLRDHDVRALQQHSSGVELTAQGPRGVVTLQSSYVVGCDGARSMVRGAAGIGFPGSDETATGMLGDFAVTDPVLLDAARERDALVVPLDDGVIRIVLLDPGRLRVPSDEPVTLSEFRESLTSLCGTDCGIAEPTWLSRFGNATRIAENYRAGRVLLAGDAAHIHFPGAGQGLNMGLQDAVNLGWKLAAEVNGWAPPGLLDTYDAERRPVGQTITDNTQVQALLIELMATAEYQRPASALREMLAGLLRFGQVNRQLAGEISGLGISYPPSGPQDDPLNGRRMPDIEIHTGESGTRLSAQLHDGQFVLLDFTGDAAAAEHGDRIRVVPAKTTGERTDFDDVTEILVRPDGHIAWATRLTDVSTRRTERALALRAWAGIKESI
ncbi:monooxygenase [Kibdelosporangium phytohabitans]|uniref:Monooxygenase n=1 Tax=Kibdelosporangium phytohabitans TaxID=860235 RepID=A0A0N9I2T6_9PSEU|nr:monooxygenase [Kibdelosporangium phytohabitans]ALG10349.1 monooxygenase [Kibdelosporangium phytohabitans]MBE1461394.1 2-polyprenyl-6-methoxyphenol hydroxylase-like FAD-dependent oxidoreductase [Kibdelosporangium phytohabitans]